MQYLLTSAMHQSLGTSKGEGFFSNEDHSQGALMHAVFQSQEADHKQLEIISHCKGPGAFKALGLARLQPSSLVSFRGQKSLGR